MKLKSGGTPPVQMAWIGADAADRSHSAANAEPARGSISLACFQCRFAEQLGSLQVAFGGSVHEVGRHGDETVLAIA